jgi:hypothetical protein
LSFNDPVNCTYSNDCIVEGTGQDPGLAEPGIGTAPGTTEKHEGICGDGVDNDQICGDGIDNNGINGIDEGCSPSSEGTEDIGGLSGQPSPTPSQSDSQDRGAFELGPRVPGAPIFAD